MKGTVLAMTHRLLEWEQTAAVTRIMSHSLLPCKEKPPSRADLREPGSVLNSDTLNLSQQLLALLTKDLES